MPIYHFENNKLHSVNRTSFSAEGILERKNLQSALKKQIEIIDSNCLVIAEEFSEWSGSQRRIDLLAIDTQANLVVIELKRTETGEHMELQAIRYASMVSTLTFKRATEIYQNFLNDNNVEEDAESKILSFLGWEEGEEDDFALDTRIILVSSNFSKELTTSVMWLNSKDIDIKCVRLIPYNDNGKIIIDIQQIIPLPEAESYQIKIKQQTEERREAKKTSRDYTKYIFKDQTYNKRKLVLAVIKDWVSQNVPNSLADLQKTFPNNLRTGGKNLRGGNLYATLQEALEVYDRQGIHRYFTGKNEILTFEGEGDFAISNQWGKGNIERFIFHAKSVGYEIEETR